jgi:hypothetical protein
MRRLARENALVALMALAASATVAWLGLYGYAWNDYEVEALPAFATLAHGHLGEFLRLAPAYGGSLIERAPFAMSPLLWGGGDIAIYRMAALPCLLAAAMLGVWMFARMRSEARPPLARMVALGLCVANPLTLRALEVGHPEELIGACMCVAAVLLAGAERPLWAGLMLGLAIANKEWALLATGPVLLALPARRRPACAASALMSAAVVLAPLALIGSSGFATATRGAASPSGTIFQPWQLWWFLGHHGPAVHGLFGSAKPGYRTGPAWTSAIAHPLILLSGAGVSAALWLRERRRGATSVRTALLALTLIMLLRCLLDTWDTEYYLLPFVFALLAWEVRGARERPPLLALSSTALAWLSFQWLPSHVSADLQAAFFLTWSLALALMLAGKLLEPRRRGEPARPLRGAAAEAQEMTVSALSRPLSTS